MKNKYTLLAFFLFTFSLFAQNPKWIIYNDANSGLPINSVRSLAIDGSGNKWIATTNGLAEFDGTNWTVYDTSNSGLPFDFLTSLAIDGNGNKWIGTGRGLAKFDGTNWVVYDTSNSGLPSNFVQSLAIDGSGNIWIATPNFYYGGLAKFDGTNWTVYNTSNSGLPINLVHSLAIDGSGNVWIGTDDGLAKFEGTNWTDYNEDNSGLPNNHVITIVIDESGNKWIGAEGGGLTVYKEGGIVSVEENINEMTPTSYSLSQNYPNPFNPTTSIEYLVPSSEYVSLKVYDILGNQVATLVNEQKPAGNYVARFNASNLASGLYFYKIQAGSFSQVRKMMLIK